MAIYNLGGGQNGINLMGTIGNPSAYSFCFPENEERSPWEPFHVSRGWDPEASTLTVLSGGWSHSGNSGNIDNVAKYISGFTWPCGVVVVLDPLTAKKYIEQGLVTKEDVEDYLW